MARKALVQENGIILTERWKLHRLDGLNWELCSRSGEGEHWRPFGRYYSYNTFDNALRFVADRELGDECAREAMDVEKALDRYEAILGDMAERVASALGGEAA